MKKNRELIHKMKEIENNNRERMFNQMDAIIHSNAEQNRTKCLELAVLSLKSDSKALEDYRIIERAEYFYEWVCKR